MDKKKITVGQFTVEAEVDENGFLHLFAKGMGPLQFIEGESGESEHYVLTDNESIAAFENDPGMLLRPAERERAERDPIFRAYWKRSHPNMTTADWAATLRRAEC